MSEKVVLTKEQAEAIGFAKKHHMRHELIDAFMKVKDTKFTGNLKVLYELSYDKFFKALYIGYEVEPEFSIGDWVVYKHNNTIWKIIGELYGGKVHYYMTRDGKYKESVHKDHIRLATPEEIAAEKERRTKVKLEKLLSELTQEEIKQLRDKLAWEFGSDGQRLDREVGK